MEGLEDKPFTNPVRSRAPAHLKSFVVTFFLVPDLRVGDADALLEELNAMGLTGPQSIRDRGQK